MKKKVFRERYEELIEWAEENGASKVIVFEPSKDGKKLEKIVEEIKPKKPTKKKEAK